MGRAVHHTMLPALNEIETSQAHPTENTMKATNQLLDYSPTYRNPKIRVYASNMILYADSDAAYLVLPKAHSRIAGYYLSSKQPPLPHKSHPPLNGLIWIECCTLPLTVASVAETETDGLFINVHYILPIHLILAEIGHPQLGPTPLKSDNSMAIISPNIFLELFIKTSDQNISLLDIYYNNVFIM